MFIWWMPVLWFSIKRSAQVIIAGIGTQLTAAQCFGFDDSEFSDRASVAGAAKARIFSFLIDLMGCLNICRAFKRFINRINCP